MAGDGDVVVVDHQLHGQAVGHGETGRLGVVPLLLGPVGAQAEQGAAGVGQGHPVHEGPQVAEAAGAELHPGGEAEFGVAGQAGVGGPVVQQILGLQLAPQHRHQVLGGHAVAGLVEEDRHEALRCSAEEGVEEHHLRHRVVGPSGVASHAPGGAGGSEEDDGVAAETDVGLQHALLLGAQPGLGGIEGQGPPGLQIDRKTEAAVGVMHGSRAGGLRRGRAGLSCW